VRFVNLL